MVPVSEYLKSVKIGLKLPLFVNTFLPVTSKPDELETNFFLQFFFFIRAFQIPVKNIANI